MVRKDFESTQVFKRSAKLSDRFDIIRILGQGSAGVVYAVRDRHRGGQELALKLLSNELAFDEHTIARFREELEVCRKINHPNLVQAYDLIDLNDALAFTMELIKGCDLGQLIGQNKFSYNEIDNILYQLLDALKALHSINIVHRDIKLENIMLREDGVVKLSDLGLIKKIGTKGVTKPGILLGTPQYMPPEYVRQAKYDTRSDIYACGVVLYELLSGQRRLADKPGGVALEHLLKTNFEFPALTLPPQHKKYVRILQGALDISPDKRFQTVEEMQKAFMPQIIEGEDNYKVRGSVVFGGSKQKPKHSKVMLLAYVGIIFILSFLAALSIFSSR